MNLYVIHCTVDITDDHIKNVNLSLLKDNLQQRHFEGYSEIETWDLLPRTLNSRLTPEPSNRYLCRDERQDNRDSCRQ